MQRFLLLIIWFVFSQVADAQDILRGLVLDGETGEPIVGATVYDAKRGKVLTVTDTDGKFRIPRQRGLAHFLEHMAFNGTKHFPGVSTQSGGRKGGLGIAKEPGD